MIVLWVVVIVICVYIGSLPILIFIGKMNDIEDHINSTYFSLPEDQKRYFKDIQSAVRWVFFIGMFLYGVVILLISIFCFYKAFLEEQPEVYL